MGEKQGHTPGPWRIDVNGSEDWSVDYDGPSSTYMTICGARPQPVCFAVEPSAYGNDEEVEANARLIAAAPDLLAALIEARDALHQHYVDWDGEPEDAVSLQLARSKCDDAIARVAREGGE